MKKILIILLLTIGNLYAQNTEPHAVDFTFNLNGAQTTSLLSVDLFPQTEFILGFQWGGGYYMNRALNGTESKVGD